MRDCSLGQLRHLFIALVVACLGFPATSFAGVLILAPHPDDDIIIASGITSRSVGFDEVTVVYMTNGDVGGKASGLAREAESVSAQVGFLGTVEDNLIFLGYPDSGLLEIFNGYTTSTSQYETYLASG